MDSIDPNVKEKFRRKPVQFPRTKMSKKMRSRKLRKTSTEVQTVQTILAATASFKRPHRMHFDHTYHARDGPEHPDPLELFGVAGLLKVHEVGDPTLRVQLKLSVLPRKLLAVQVGLG